MIQCVVSVAMESDSDRITRLEKKVTLLTSLYKRYEEKYNAEVSKTALLKKIVTQSDKLIQALQKTRRSSSAAAAAPATTADPAGSGATPAKHTIYLVSATGQPGLAAFLENTFASFTNNRSPRFAQCVSVKFDRFAAATSGIKLPHSVCIFLINADSNGRWAADFKDRKALYDKAVATFEYVVLGCTVPTDATDVDPSDMQIKARQQSWEGRIKMAMPLAADPKTQQVYVDAQSFNQVFIKRMALKTIEMLDTEREYAV